MADIKIQVGLQGGYDTTQLTQGTKGFEDANHPNADENGVVKGDDRTHGGHFSFDVGPSFRFAPDANGVGFLFSPALSVGFAGGKNKITTYTPGHLPEDENGNPDTSACPEVMGTPLCNEDTDGDGTGNGALNSRNSNNIYGQHVNFSRFRIGLDLPVGFTVKDKVDVYGLLGFGIQPFTKDAYAVMGNADAEEGDLPRYQGLQELGTESPDGYVRMGGGFDVALGPIVSLGLRAAAEFGKVSFIPRSDFANTVPVSTGMNAFDLGLRLTVGFPVANKGATTESEDEPVARGHRALPVSRGSEPVEDHDGDSVADESDVEATGDTTEIVSSSTTTNFTNDTEIQRLVLVKASELNIPVDTLLKNCDILSIYKNTDGKYVVTRTNQTAMELQGVTSVQQLIDELSCEDCGEEDTLPSASSWNQYQGILQDAANQLGISDVGVLLDSMTARVAVNADGSIRVELIDGTQNTYANPAEFQVYMNDVVAKATEIDVD